MGRKHTHTHKQERERKKEKKRKKQTNKKTVHPWQKKTKHSHDSPLLCKTNFLKMFFRFHVNGHPSKRNDFLLMSGVSSDIQPHKQSCN